MSYRQNTYNIYIQKEEKANITNKITQLLLRVFDRLVRNPKFVVSPVSFSFLSRRDRENCHERTALD